MREISFVRKRGPHVVTDLKNLRPISYTDELQTLFDLAWLEKCRHLLEGYVGPEQAGVRFDSTLVSLGTLIALQTRRNWSLPTYCLKADLLQGYDLAWKAAMLLHTRWAGIQGSFWLCLNSAIQQDSFRVRYGPLVGPTMLLLVAGLGQGGRRAVHLFAALARGIPDQVLKKTVGVSIGASPLLLNQLQVHSRRPGLPQANLIPSFVEYCLTLPQHEQIPASVLNSITKDSAMLVLDVLASQNLLTLQFVDDVFIFQSTMWGVHRACQALENFLQLWRHRFAPRKVALMLVSSDPLNPINSLVLDNVKVEGVQSLPVLGPCFDCNLSFLCNLT